MKPMSKQIPIGQLGMIRDKATLRLLATLSQTAVKEAIETVKKDASIASHPKINELLSELDYLAALTKAAAVEPVRKTKKLALSKVTPSP